jgi:Ser/Thr protein kinase RdoA (MazF antagonist)
MKQPSQHEMESILGAAVLDIVPFRKNWLVKTAKGRFVAKRMHIDQLRWWMRVDRELRIRGFRNMPPVRSGNGWLVTPYLQGKSGKYSEIGTVSRMVETLARFHILGRGLIAPPMDGAAFLLHQRVHDRLARFYRALGRAKSLGNEVGAFLAKAGPDFYRDGVQAWEELSRLPLRQLAESERFAHALAHRDLASHNWIVGEDGRLWLIDFETADYDAQIGDVWQMMSRILEENNWSELWMDMVFPAYEGVRPVSPVERRILVALFSFPNEFFREAVGLVEKKKGYNPEHSLPYLRKLAENRAVWRASLRRLVYW